MAKPNANGVVIETVDFCGCTYIDRVAAALDELDPDSLLSSFYRELGEGAEARIRRQVENDD